MFPSASPSCRHFPDIPLPLLTTKMAGFLFPVITEPGPAQRRGVVTVVTARCQASRTYLQHAKSCLQLACRQRENAFMGNQEVVTTAWGQPPLAVSHAVAASSWSPAAGKG